MDFGHENENPSRLTPKKEMIAIMSNEYAKYYAESESTVLKKNGSLPFSFKMNLRKRRLKRN
jgi:hypothetical protein